MAHQEMALTFRVASVHTEGAMPRDRLDAHARDSDKQGHFRVQGKDKQGHFRGQGKDKQGHFRGQGEDKQGHFRGQGEVRPVDTRRLSMKGENRGSGHRKLQNKSDQALAQRGK